MIKHIKLPCGLDKTGKLVYIDDAKNGLACECVCPGCKKTLIAKNNGKKKEHHFAHLNLVECQHGYQSALHYMAKDLFLELRYLTFVKNSSPIQYKIDQVELECKVDEVIPDILVTCDGKKFIVEIFVTHAVDDTKKQKIKDMRISAVEINLSRFHHEMISKEVLKQELCNPANFSWIYDADIDLLRDKKEIVQQFGLKLSIQTGKSILCPLVIKQNNELARFVPFDFCIKCKNCVWDGKSNFISCAKFLPLPLNNETREKVYSTIFVNQNIVMFSSEFQKYEKTFLERLKTAVQAQIRVFQYIKRQAIVRSLAYRSSVQRIDDLPVNGNRRYYKSHPYHKSYKRKRRW